MEVLRVENIKKKLSKRQIINGVSFSINEGQIFGFLGPNGAGKTTTIRMLVGLIAADEGSIKIMGHDIKKEREKALRYIGAVVENPELYTYLSGRENIMQIARVRNVDKDYVEEIIKLVGLKDRIDDKVKKYSLGMKQRLGLAVALIDKPKLLILDEPTNGLDPSGIIEFRKIVRLAAKETKTAVFISSHILSEIQTMCDTVAFINDGVIKSVESMNESEQEYEKVALVCKDKDKCTELIKNSNLVNDFNYKDNIFNLTIVKGSIPDLIFYLSENKLAIEEIYKKHAVLEERYMEIVGGR